jgi:hypothetical protein
VLIVGSFLSLSPNANQPSSSLLAIPTVTQTAIRVYTANNNAIIRLTDMNVFLSPFVLYNLLVLLSLSALLMNGIFKLYVKNKKN